MTPETRQVFDKIYDRVARFRAFDELFEMNIHDEGPITSMLAFSSWAMSVQGFRFGFLRQMQIRRKQNDNEPSMWK